MIQVTCSSCGTHISAKPEQVGKRGRCPKCGMSVEIVANNTQKPSTPPEPPPSPPPPTPAISPAVANIANHFANEEQDPVVAAAVLEKVSQFLTTGEEIKYIAVQKRPLINVVPDAIVLTNKRFILYRKSLLGRIEFRDHIWREVVDARVTEGLLGSTVFVRVTNGQTLSLDYLPKAQARKVYAFAQEMEERVAEERRLRELEERRAASGGVVIQNPYGSGGQHSAGDNQAARMGQLKTMMDAGLISREEYELKRQEILKSL